MTHWQSLQKKFPKEWERLNDLWGRGTQFLGSPLALLGGAMTWVSEPQLVSAISNEGGFGVLASGAMTPEFLATSIRDTRKLTSQPFGVNVILLHPHIEDLVDVCLQEKVSHIVFAGGLPSRTLIHKVKTQNIRAIGFAPALVFAKKLIRDGIDALIVEGSEAGGHVGPVSTSVLAQEILPEISQVPLFIAGGIGHGKMILRYLEMGASGVQLGTLLVCTTESKAHPRFKEAFLKAQSRDAVLSPQLDPRFPVIPVRALTNEGMRSFVEKQQEVIRRFDEGLVDLKEGQLEIEHFWSGALRRAVIDGDIENGSLMAGQSVGLVKEIKPLSELFKTLLEETVTAFYTPSQ